MEEIILTGPKTCLYPMTTTADGSGSTSDTTIENKKLLLTLNSIPVKEHLNGTASTIYFQSIPPGTSAKTSSMLDSQDKSESSLCLSERDLSCLIIMRKDRNSPELELNLN